MDASHATSSEPDLGADFSVLGGIKVIDFTRHMAGPLATQVLGDFGADVLKVESMPYGDPLRRIGTQAINGVNAMFLHCNRNKRSIAVDLREKRGLEVVHRLISEADIFVENYRPGVTDDIGIGYDEMSRLNPRLLYCSASAFGPTGPLATYKGMDPIVQAMSGIMSVTGESDGGPCLVGVPIVDFSTGMIMVQAILLGLLARERTGRGQHLKLSLLGSAVSSLATRLAAHWASDVDPTRQGSAHSIVVPYKAFKTADGYALAGVWQDDQWEPFCDIISRPDLKDDPRFQTRGDRLENRVPLELILDDIFISKTTAEWELRFRQKNGLFGPVLTLSEVFAHPQLKELGLVQSVTHPEAGTIRQLAPVIDMSATPGTIRLAPPLYGQHTLEALRSVDYNPAEIKQLVEDGVVVAAEQ